MIKKMKCYDCGADMSGYFWFDISKCKGNVNIHRQALCPGCTLRYVEKQVPKLVLKIITEQKE